MYSDYEFLERVWSYHQQMVEAILNEEYDAGYRALIEHIGMLHSRPELGQFAPTKLAEAGENHGLKSNGVKADG